MVSIKDWKGQIKARKEVVAPVTITLPLQQGAHGGSGAFLAKGSDGRRWWVKPINNGQGPRVLVAEYIVGKLGQLIGAPVCETSVVEIPPALAGWEFRPGLALVPGLGHGSVAVQDAFEEYALNYRDRDNNRVRHAGVLALYDWCFGNDDQWLYSETQDRKVYSHDHGLYFPNQDLWTEDSLAAHVDRAHLLDGPHVNLDKAELTRLSGALRGVTRKQLRAVLSDVPLVWPATDSELASIGCFLERRANAVADRLDELAGAI